MRGGVARATIGVLRSDHHGGSAARSLTGRVRGFALAVVALCLLVPRMGAATGGERVPASVHSASSEAVASSSHAVAWSHADRSTPQPILSEWAPSNRPSRSSGYPWRGGLENSVRLQESATLRFMDVDRPRGNFFGTRRLVGLLERTAAVVDERAPGARMNVGELSRRTGGNIVGHRSHENGRDVDLGFYMVDDAGLPVETRRFLNVRRSGRARNAVAPGPDAPGESGLQFDPIRNWMMIEALITDPEVVVQHAFVHRDVRRLLVRQGRRMGASDDLIERVERVVISPGVRHPHRNHFHVRIYCGPDDMPGCRDRGPFWPWLGEGHPFHGLVVPLPGVDVEAQRAISATRRTAR